MTETTTWSTPECPFVIEYSARAVDDIRLGVVDAFFSLPRGGAEIGGILLGKWEEGRLTISDYAALDCEHAFGPSFALSPRDESKLADLIKSADADDARPVGWYHSHTRSEIFLSDADIEIHRRFFPEPWQVALVIKPHTFQPARAGFFFLENDGSIHGEASYTEIILDPLAVRPIPAGALAVPGPAIDSAANGAIVEAMPSPDPEPAVAVPEPAPEPAMPAVSAETREPLPPVPAPQPSGAPRWPKVVIPLAVGAVLGAAAYWKRDLWIPQVMAMTGSARPAPAPLALGLNTSDLDGQLQIRWNPDSPAVHQAANGALSIASGGSPPQEIPLDRPHLLSGVFTLGRTSERVDVALSITELDGRARFGEVTTFLGKLPERKPVQDPAAQQQRDAMRARNRKDKGPVGRRDSAEPEITEIFLIFSSSSYATSNGAALHNQAPDKK